MGAGFLDGKAIAGEPEWLLIPLFFCETTLHLQDDYKLEGMCFLWEFSEVRNVPFYLALFEQNSFQIVRKLSLSIVGSFWSEKTPMAVAIALLLSVFFLILQHHFQVVVMLHKQRSHTDS